MTRLVMVAHECDKSVCIYIYFLKKIYAIDLIIQYGFIFSLSQTIYCNYFPLFESLCVVHHIVRYHLYTMTHFKSKSCKWHRFLLVKY